jgi:hypothetical protein
MASRDPFISRASSAAPSKPRSWLFDSLRKSFASRYMRASVVYLVYTSLIMYINYKIYPEATASYSDDYYYSTSSDGGGT